MRIRLGRRKDRADRHDALRALKQIRQANDRNQPIAHNHGDTEMHLSMGVPGDGSN